MVGRANKLLKYFIFKVSFSIYICTICTGPYEMHLLYLVMITILQFNKVLEYGEWNELQKEFLLGNGISLANKYTSVVIAKKTTSFES